jgi:hypothetical protein
MKIECLRSHVVSGGHTYPIYIGFAKAEDIAKVAMAPAVTRSTPNREIAENITSQPVKDWQRPIDLERVEGIASTFNNSGGLMPNPVLLSNNAFYQQGVTISPNNVHSYATNTFTVDIAEDTPPDQKSLWILDGQHRIFGLSKSAQKDNLVPVVLLLSQAAGSYTSPGLAKIFAQVTTAAKKLDELHNEWLTYAFELERYAVQRPNSQQTKQAFATVVELCRTPEWNGVANPFFNQVQFNETVSVSPSLGGFSFRCNVLSDLLLRSYYLVSAAIPHRTPAEVAQELARAYQALHQMVLNPAASVFFGASEKQQQTIMQEAFFVGVLARMLLHGSTADYATLFQGLNFHQTNWEFSWTKSLGAQQNAASKKIARRVFDDALSTGALPTGSSNLADHLRGNGAAVTLRCSRLSPAGRPAKHGHSDYVAQRGSVGSQNVGVTPNIRIIDKTSNVEEVVVHDKSRPKDTYRAMQRSSGLTVDDSLPKPLMVQIFMQHYGGLSSEAEVEFNW